MSTLAQTATPSAEQRQATGDAFLPFSAPWFGPEEKAEIAQVLESDWITSGPRVKKFEAMFAEYIGCAEAVAVNSCTGALHLALAALDIGPGDAVITSPLTFAATANVIAHRGARPVFVDVRQDTGNLDETRLAVFLEQGCEWNEAEKTLHMRDGGQRVRAIIAVHYGGHPCEMAAITALAERYRLEVIEDAAHALGASYQGRKAGHLGRCGCFSFYPTKNICTGEGGMLTTGDAQLAQRTRRLALHGISRDAWKRYARDGSWQYDIEECGFKYNLTDLAAALGIHQLAKLESFNARRAELAAFYRQRLAALPLRHPVVLEGVTSAWHLYPVRVLSRRVTRDAVIEALRRRNIGSSVHFIPLHLMSFYQRAFGYARGDFPVAESLFDTILSLPFFPRMSDEDAERVARALEEIFAE
jgi:dTDP-4-amino-4,6-dideoxygalactose transaminase